MKKETFPSKKTIALFDRKRKLVGILNGVNMIGELLGVTHNAVTQALTGKAITVKDYYVRPVPGDNMELEQSDLGNLDLVDYDLDTLHQDRLIYLYTTAGLMYRGNTITESEYRKISNNKSQIYKRRRK